MYLNQNLNLINNQLPNLTIKYNIILYTLQLQPYQIQMASKQSPSTSTFIEEGQGPMPQLPITAHGKSNVPTTSAHSYAVPKYVTDVARLISASAESRRMFLTEVTRTCLEAAKKDKADSHQMITLQLGQSITNANKTSTSTIFSTSTSSNTATKPVAAVHNTSGTEMKRRVEDGNQIKH